MKLDARWTRALLIVLAVAFAAASLAPPADADHGRRYKGDGPWVAGPAWRGPAPPAVYVSHHSDALPMFAGFIGGLVIGNAIAHAAPPPAYCPPPAPVDDDTYYYDPYCHVRFWSLDRYGSHLCYTRHPAVVRVIEVDRGRCVGELEWQDGRWRDCDGRDEDRGGDWDR